MNDTGAGSQFLDSAFTALIDAQAKPATALAVRNALAHAEVLSADTNDGVNPIFPQNSENSNAAIVGYGVAIKRYGAGFDPNSEFTARVLHLLDANHIAWQTQTPKVDVGGGGTIGGFLSMRNMEVLDVGIPLLSMHCHLRDVFEGRSLVVLPFHACLLHDGMTWDCSRIAKGKHDTEGCSAVFRADDQKIASVHFGNCLGDCQSQPAALNTAA